MSIIGKYTADTTEDDDNKESQGFTLPVVIKKQQEENLKRDIIVSAILHPAVLGAIYLISLILLLFGIHFSIFDRPKPKMLHLHFRQLRRIEADMTSSVGAQAVRQQARLMIPATLIRQMLR